METVKRVSGLKVRVTKDPELKTSAKGVSFFKANAVHDKQDGEAVWLTVLGFKGISKSLAEHIKKGSLLKVSGKVTTKEYQKKDGGMGIDNSLIVDSALVSTAAGLVEIDEFGVTLPANPEETKATTEAPF